jgi:two-component system, chemotaxis family, protein-glutamate methylesterase/glutaminase
VTVASPRLVVVGTSLGGMRALQTVLGGLTFDFPLPVAVVQHRGADVTPSQMAPLLQLHSALPVAEAEDKQTFQAGHIYLAPSDYHLLVDAGKFALTVDERVQHARPSIDVLFESAADAYREAVLAVVLTGASADGAQGALRIKRRGGTVVAQDPLTAEAPTMPQAAITAGAVDRVLLLAEIAPYLNALRNI